MKKKKVKAIALVSGGLDSTVAVQMIKDQGIEVKGINFNTGFCITDHKKKINRPDMPLKKMRNEALRAAADTQIPLEIIDLSKDYMEKVVLNPKYGYGAGLNPCLDCRIYMLKKAKQIMEKEKADFIFTGEVLGQRPKSQRSHQLRIIEQETGLEGLLLRPLSAKLLEETLVEKMGLVNREKLGNISGRSRKPQIELAQTLNILDYPQPAGGCCSLPDPNYAGRLLDLIKHQKKVSKEDALLLKVGRHFRLNKNAKLIVGRDELENNFLIQYPKGKAIIETVGYVSPTTLLIGSFTKKNIEIAGGITLRYADCPKDQDIPFSVRLRGKTKIFKGQALSQETIETLRVKPKS